MKTMLGRAQIFQLVLTFFGLTQDYRLFFFKQIHEIVFNGQGGYDWPTVYNMPIWLRKFTFETLKEHYDKQAKEQETLNAVAAGAQGE